jgi:hypothetical protein
MARAKLIAARAFAFGRELFKSRQLGTGRPALPTA